MRAACLALGIATQHARDLGYAIGWRQYTDVGGRYAFTRAFRYDYVVMCARGDLRKVRNREYLVLLGHAAHGVANLQSDAPPDSGVDFVEDQCWDVIDTGEDGLQCEHYAREFAA